MQLVGALGAANALMRNTATLVHELRRPRPDGDAAFAELLKQHIESGQPNGPAGVNSEALLRASERFVQTRDKSGTGKLNQQESGLSAQTFRSLDANGDGKLSVSELHQYLLRAASRK